MITVQPHELVRVSDNQYVLKCDDHHSELVEFVFTADEENEQQIRWQDVFWFATAGNGDDGHLSTIWCVHLIDGVRSESKKLFDLPQLDMRVSKIRCGESTDGCASYVVTFEAGAEAADREFSVRQLDDYKKN